MANFDEWWNQNYDDSENPFEKDSFGYWAYAGWCAAMQVEKPIREEASFTDVNDWVSKPHREDIIRAEEISAYKLKEKNNA